MTFAFIIAGFTLLQKLPNIFANFTTSSSNYALIIGLETQLETKLKLKYVISQIKLTNNLIILMLINIFKALQRKKSLISNT